MRRFLLRGLLLVAAVALVFLPIRALAETYTHGYLRYEVADQSVTITGYAGSEETVTVPAMIGGNPVNTIAAGSFSGASSVVVVYLPDTVTSVEQGAFGTGQAVVFGGRTGGSADTTGEDSTASGDPESPADSGGDEGSGGNSAQEATTPGGASADGGSALGIRTSEGSLVTVDSEGHLVLVDPSGTERVLDDSRSYKRVTRADGTAAIVNDAGDDVVVADGSKVSFSDAEGRQAVVDTARGTTTTTAEGGSYGYEEVDIDDDVDDAKAASVASGAGSSETADVAASKTQGAGAGLVPLVAAAIVVAAAILWQRSKHQ